MNGPVVTLEEQVRDLVRERGIDPQGDDSALQRVVDEVLDEHQGAVERGSKARLGDAEGTRKTLLDRIAGLGPLQPLMDDPNVEEIWINGPGRVFFAANGRHNLSNIVLEERQIQSLVERMLRGSGRRIDLSTPFVDATLRDGSRVHVAIPDVTRQHWAVNIRKFILKAHRLDELIRLGSLSQSAAGFLRGAVLAGMNIVVSGGTQTGKTTMLNCLAAGIDPADRVITCEEVFELKIALPDVVAMQTRSANLENRGAIDLRRLIVEALRMRPDRIIVGEVRGREAFDLLIALNSGLPGMTSIHANSAREALLKLITLPLLAGENVSHAFVVPTVASTVDVIVHLARQGTRRHVEQIVGVTGRVESDVIETASLWDRRHEELAWTGQQPPGLDRFRAAGIDTAELMK